MPLPLVEALSALSTLLGTYQVVRGSKPPGEAPVVSESVTAPGLVLAYQFVRSEADDAARRLDSVRSRLLHVVIVAGVALVGAAGIAAVGDEAPSLDSALFLAALGMFCFIAALGTLVRNFDSGKRASPFEIYEKYLVEPDSRLLDGMLRYTQSAYERTEALIAIGRPLLLFLSMVLVAQIVLLAVWIALGD